MPLTRPSSRVLLCSALLIGGCAHDAAKADRAQLNAPIAVSEAKTPPAQRVTPRADHHQHLLSPEAAALSSTRVSAPVSVPSGVAELLSRRAEFSADRSRLAQLFTEDVLLRGPGNMGGWIRGRERAAQFIEMTFAPGYRLTPIFFRDRGNFAEVAGYYSRGEGETLRHPGYFSMSLVKEPNGRWRIASEVPVFPGPVKLDPVDAADLIAMLDAAAIDKAIVFSNAYYFDGLISVEGDPYAQARAENDWTAGQVSRFPARLIAFCSFNPLTDYAVAELERCAREPEFKGLKLHFGTSGVDLTKTEHVEKVRQVVQAANRLQFPITFHLTASPDYGRQHSRIFIEQVLPAAPDVAVIIAHLWGGAGYTDEALAAYAEAISSGDPRTKNLHFDLAQIAMVEGKSEENLRKMTERIRQIGLDRMLYGSDGVAGNGMPPREVWSDFRARMPLSEEEFSLIAANVLPVLR